MSGGSGPSRRGFLSVLCIVLSSFFPYKLCEPLQSLAPTCSPGSRSTTTTCPSPALLCLSSSATTRLQHQIHPPLRAVLSLRPAEAMTATTRRRARLGSRRRTRARARRSRTSLTATAATSGASRSLSRSLAPLAPTLRSAPAGLTPSPRRNSLDVPSEPVVTPCGHLHCWPCMHEVLPLLPRPPRRRPAS